MQNQKYKLNKSTLLVIGEDLDNINYRLKTVDTSKYTMVDAVTYNNVNHDVDGSKYIKYDGSDTLTTGQFIKASLFFSSEIDVNSEGFFFNLIDRDGNILISAFEKYQYTVPMQIINIKNTLYTTRFDFWLPYNLLTDNLQFHINNNVYMNMANEIIDNTATIDGVFISKVNLSYENLVSDIINDANINVKLSINDNKFLVIEPISLVTNKTIQQYLYELFKLSDYVPEIFIRYQVNFINQHGTYEKITISNDDNIYGKIKMMIDVNDMLVDSIDDLPLTINVVMITEIDNFKIHRDATITYNYILKNPNEIVNNIDISSLVRNEIVDKVNVVNQTIVQTPAYRDPTISVVKMETPIFTNQLVEDVKLADFSGYIKFVTLDNINIGLTDDNKIKLTLRIDGKLIDAEYENNNNVIFNVDSLDKTPQVNTEFQVLLINNNQSNLQEKTQIVLKGRII